MKNGFLRSAWFVFRQDWLAQLGLFLVVTTVFLAVFADFITPYPEHASSVGDFLAMNSAPSATYWMGTDTIGRDLFTRIIYAYRTALLMSLVVLAIAPPIGVIVGLLAGYFGGRTEYVLMRLTDVFLSVPPLVLAMAILGFLEPTLTNGMLAVTAMWWPWYARLTYSVARVEKQEGYVLAAQTIGASSGHILFWELLPNCLPPVLTKMAIDVGFVIIMASSLSFVGLGVQAPTPDLGSMVADGTQYMPDSWWLTVFPAVAILVIVLGFNLFADGMRHVLEAMR